MNNKSLIEVGSEFIDALKEVSLNKKFLKRFRKAIAKSNKARQTAHDEPIRAKMATDAHEGFGWNYQMPSAIDRPNKGQSRGTMEYRPSGNEKPPHTMLYLPRPEVTDRSLTDY